MRLVDQENPPPASHELADGRIIELGAERFDIPERLFANEVQLSPYS